METLLNILLKLGISPAGIALIGLIITWFFVVFYFMPRLQHCDETETQIKELNEKTNTNKDLIMQLIGEVKQIHTIANINKKNIQEIMDNSSEFYNKYQTAYKQFNNLISIVATNTARLNKIYTVMQKTMAYSMMNSGDDKLIKQYLLDNLDSLLKADEQQLDESHFEDMIKGG